MPHFRIETNVSADKIPATFLTDTTALIAKTLGKPESYCVVTVIPDVKMSWGGDASSPCATAILQSVGKLGVSENKKHAKALYDHVQKHLGVPKDKMYITFQDSAPEVLGYNGSTFHGIL